MTGWWEDTREGGTIWKLERWTERTRHSLRGTRGRDGIIKAAEDDELWTDTWRLSPSTQPQGIYTQLGHTNSFRALHKAARIYTHTQFYNGIFKCTLTEKRDAAFTKQDPWQYRSLALYLGSLVLQAVLISWVLGTPAHQHDTPRHPYNNWTWIYPPHTRTIIHSGNLHTDTVTHTALRHLHTTGPYIHTHTQHSLGAFKHNKP